MKRKNINDHHEVSSTEWTTNSGHNGMASSPFHTPVSGKGGRTVSRLKATRNNISAPPTPSSNAGKRCLQTHLVERTVLITYFLNLYHILPLRM